MRDRCFLESECPWGTKPECGMYSEGLGIHATDCILYKECPRRFWNKAKWLGNKKTEGTLMLCIFSTNLCIKISTEHILYRSFLRYANIVVPEGSIYKMRYNKYTPEELGFTENGCFYERLETLIKRCRG